MDVRCERCKTEYEFDDARITEAGVTVKCTTCGHVFKVKKKALVVTVPVKPGEVELSAPAPTTAAGERPREWKVRQGSGNVFTFKELTTLQKWIVERKVNRDDEISLTGESWKRLGNIAELASFFQVVEEAQRAAALEAQAATNSGVFAAPLGRPPTQTGTPAVHGTPAPPRTLTQPGVVPVSPPQRTPTSPSFPTEPQQVGRMSKAGPEPAFAKGRLTRSAITPPPPPEDERPPSRGFGKLLVGLFLLMALGAAGYFGYFNWWLPQEQKRAAFDRAEAERREREAREKPAGGVEAAEKAAAEKVAAEKAAAEKAAADKLAAEKAAAEKAKPDAGAAAVKVAKAEPVRDFDWYMDRGDHLRERDQASAALDAYGKASDLQPTRAEPMAGKGLALLDLGNVAAAEAALKQSLKLNARYGVAIIGLAEMYRSQGKKDLAIEFYEKYLDTVPNGAEAPAARAALKKLKE